jgi:hypothetical protein
MALVDYPDIAKLAPRACLDRRTVPRDRVSVQIQGDVVRANHDAVVRTVDEIGVERRVGGDGRAAGQVAGQRPAVAKSKRTGHAKRGRHRK